ncbi:DeoR/GlpR family DNA-binding transcription regulator [Cohnella zeiphila]|uniref:DeoR/GlpR transcriptional regulator n=1 Tax=Cohnella zeiphila TaxID=2761120 RepID=A0A7X0SI36_9BACL|nr:DeoR/GlpR family DNA-binding transcription regulator [Cohnella zeiphila]MBB6730411.1 DeoR/GlpR transcriptional regulator [Cohnella zeiphila]
MLAEERRQRILETLRAEGHVVAKELAERFDISIDSVRRDLTLMEEQGHLQKTYGGAVAPVPAPKTRALPKPEEERYGDGSPHQDAIAKRAASYIRSHDTVFIGGAGIHFGMLKHLPSDIPFTVVTNSIKIAEAIRKREFLTSYLIGGKLRAESAGSMIDVLAIEMIGKFAMDIVFMTGGGIGPAGVSTATPEGAAFARAAAQASRRRICLAPHEKLGHRQFVVSVPIDTIDILITDLAAPKNIIEQIERQRVQVVYADDNETMGSGDREMDSR